MFLSPSPGISSQRLFYSGSWITSNHLRVPISHRESRVLTEALKALCHLLPPEPRYLISSCSPWHSAPATLASLLFLKHGSTTSCRAFALTVPSVWDVFLQIFPQPTAPSLFSGLCSGVTPSRWPFFLFFFNSFYFWLHWVFVAVHRLSLVVSSGGYSSLRCVGFSLWWLLWLRSTGSRCTGFSSCGMQAQ